MFNHCKKIVAIIAVISVVLGCIFCEMQVSGECTGLEASLGNPTMNDTADGFYEFTVTSITAVCTKEYYDLEKQDLILKDFSIPENTYWGVISFCQVPAGNQFTFMYEEGLFPLFIRGDIDHPDRHNLFIWNGANEIPFGYVERSDYYVISFCETEKGFALKVNGKTFINDYVKEFCEKGYHKNSKVNFFALNWMSGKASFADRDWDVVKSEKTPLVYQKQNGGYSVKAPESTGTVFSNNKIDFSKNSLEFSSAKLGDGKKFTVALDKNAKADVNGDLKLGFAQSGDKVNVTLEGASAKVLGTIPVADSYKLALAKNGSNYSLAVNGVILNSDANVNSFAKSGLSAYVTVALPIYFEADIYTTELAWSQVSGEGNASITLNPNGSNKIEVSAGQYVKAPRVYDFMATGVKLSNLDIPANSNSKGAIICFGKSAKACLLGVTNNDSLSLLVQKTDSKVQFNLLIDNNGTKVLLGEMPISNEYSISLYKKHKAWRFKVNDVEFNLKKLTTNNSELAREKINAFFGDEESVLVHIAFTTNDVAKASIDTFSYQRIPNLVGFSVYSDGRTYEAVGDEEVGYSVTTKKETYVFTNTVYNTTKEALSFRLAEIKAPLYFAVSTTEITDKNFWVCGDGKTSKRFVFVINPKENNTKAEIAYYGADGVNATETVIDTIDFDWTTKHSFDVRKADDNNWYLTIDAKVISAVKSTVLNDFMNINADDIFYAFGSKEGINVSAVRIIESPVGNEAVEGEGWSSWYGVKPKDLVKNDSGYTISKTNGGIYAFTKGTNDITKTSLSIKINQAKKWFYFAISRTDMSDTKISQKGTAKEINRIEFRMVPDTENGNLTINAWNMEGKGEETLLGTVPFDATKVHTFDIRLATDNNWYLSVDNKIVAGVVNNILQDFIDRYGVESLYYGIGSFGGLVAEEINVINQAPGDVLVNMDTWHYMASDGRGPFEGNDKDGYGIEKECTVFGYTDRGYDITETALNFTLSDVGAWTYFCLSKTDYMDLNWLEVGHGSIANRIILLIVPIGDQAQFQYWAMDGKTPAPTIVATFDFEWFGENHVLDVRKNKEDGNWYFCIDGRMLMNRVFENLNAFMEVNENEKIRYGFGGMNCFGVRDLKIVEKPALKQSTDQGFDEISKDDITGDYEFEFEFENNLYEEEDFGSEDFEIADEEEVIEDVTEEEVDPLAGLQKVKVKKRRLVSAAHGIIFTPLEKAAMVLGGALLLGGVAFVIVFAVIKTRKKKVVKK